MLFIPNIERPLTDLPNVFNYFDNLSATGNNVSNAAPILYSGALATMVRVSGNGTEGVRLVEDAPLGAQFWVTPLFNGITLLVAVGLAGYSARRRLRAGTVAQRQSLIGASASGGRSLRTCATLA